MYEITAFILPPFLFPVSRGFTTGAATCQGITTEGVTSQGVTTERVTILGITTEGVTFQASQLVEAHL